MAVYSHGNTNVSMAGARNWSNTYGTSATNVSLTTLIGTDMYPAGTAPHQLSEIRNDSFLHGIVYAGGGGTVSVTGGYTESAASQLTLKNVNFSSVATVTITATATYPYTFHSFRTGAGGGGSALSTTGAGTTTGTISLTSSNHQSVTAFYAHFTTTHLVP